MADETTRRSVLRKVSAATGMVAGVTASTGEASAEDCWTETKCSPNDKLMERECCYSGDPYDTREVECSDWKTYPLIPGPCTD